MKIYDDIHAYYPSSLFEDLQFYPDFTILKLENLTESLTPNYLSKYSQPHIRDFFEIAIGTAEPNSAYMQIGVENVISTDNDIVFVSPTQSFSIEFDKKGNVHQDHGFLIAFKPSFLLSKKRSFEIISTFRYFNSYTLAQYVLTKQQLAPIIEMASLLHDEYTSNAPYSREILMGQLEVLLHKFNRMLQVDVEITSANPCELIAANFERKIIGDQNKISTIAHYASELNITANYLSECVKKATGKTAKQILLNHKLIVAKSLLQQPEKSITEVAFEMNFTEPTNFTKFFKKMTNMTPLQFRNSYKY